MNMTVLNDREIEDRIGKGLLITGEYDTKLVTPNGYDVRADIIRVSDKEMKEGAEIPSKSHFFISTMETISLPAPLSLLAICAVPPLRSYRKKG